MIRQKTASHPSPYTFHLHFLHLIKRAAENPSPILPPLTALIDINNEEIFDLALHKLVLLASRERLLQQPQR